MTLPSLVEILHIFVVMDGLCTADAAWSFQTVLDCVFQFFSLFRIRVGFRVVLHDVLMLCREW